MSDRLLFYRFTAAFVLAMTLVLGLVEGFGLMVVKQQVAHQWRLAYGRTVSNTQQSLGQARRALTARAQDSLASGGLSGASAPPAPVSPQEPLLQWVAVNGKIQTLASHPATLPGADAAFSALWRRAMTQGQASGFEWCAGARVCVASYVLAADDKGVRGAVRAATVLEDAFLQGLRAQSGDHFALVYQGQMLHGTLPVDHPWINRLRPHLPRLGAGRELTLPGLRARGFTLPVAGRSGVLVLMLHDTRAETAALTRLAWQSAALGGLLLVLLTLLFFYLLQLTGKALAARATVLAEQGRLAAVGELASGVAHEVNNPLTAIRGYAQMLHRKAPEGSREAGIFDEIIKEADHIHRIVRSLLGIARPASGLEDNLCLVRDAVEDTRAMSRMHGCSRDRELVVQVEENLTAPMPRTQLVQVLLNLVVNAMQASPPGGVVTLSARATTDAVVLEVADQGMGISPEHLPRLFDPFFTTKAPGEGTGLGLPVSQRLVRSAGGNISVHSTPGHGAVFTVTLPKVGGHNGVGS